MPEPIDILRSPTHSTYREQLVEYVLLAELLQDGWLRRKQRIDVLRADVDGAGYDLVLSSAGVIRHVQLKSSVEGGKTRDQKIHIDLGTHACGCVVWVVVDDGSEHRVRLRYRVMGGGLREQLPDLTAYPVAKHTKGNADGVKGARPNIRVVPQRAFRELDSTAALSDWLFGPAP